MGVLTDTLGRSEHEAMAALIVRYHHANNLADWTPVSRLALGELFKTDDVVKEWARNPFWRPTSPYEFVKHGFIIGWGEDPAAVGTLTDDFHAGLLRLHLRGARQG